MIVCKRYGGSTNRQWREQQHTHARDRSSSLNFVVQGLAVCVAEECAKAGSSTRILLAHPTRTCTPTTHVVSPTFQIAADLSEFAHR